MPNNFEFHSEIDKITERELVYDIVERMSLGKNLSEGTNILWKAGTLITDMWKKLAYMLPPSITLNFLKVKVGVISIPAGSTSGAVTITNIENGSILLAQSQQNGSDVKECITVVRNGNNIVCTMSTDIAYTHNEYIKIYAY